MRALRRGADPEQLEEFRDFVMGSQGRLRRSAYVLCGDWHLAEDIVQTAYSRVFRHWPRVRSMEVPDAYARQVVYRCFLDDRKKHRETAGFDPAAVAELVDRDARGPARDDDAAVRLTLLAALAELSPRTRAVVALRYWDDLSVEQTAAALGISEGTVKSLSARGLALLRTQLGDLWAPLPESTDTR